MKVKALIEYDGTEYGGWQVQKNRITVEEKIEQALKTLTGETVKVVGSGRTDAGVHARGQVAHFCVEKENIPAERFAFALNVLLPNDIKILKTEKAKECFDARKSAKRKTYKYTFYVSDTVRPLKERFATRIKAVPDLFAMRMAAEVLKGEHDFKNYCASGGGAKTSVREIYDLEVEEFYDEIIIKVTGNGFLYNMVRIIAGTLLAVGEHKLDLNDVIKSVNGGERIPTQKTLPAKGLCLESVKYE